MNDAGDASPERRCGSPRALIPFSKRGHLSRNRRIKRIKRKRSAMKADNSTFGRFKAGATDIVIDDVAAIAKEAGDAIMEIYNGTSEADWK